MTGRISIPALREWATHGLGWQKGLAEEDAVLALVEAVEAAHQLQRTWAAHNSYRDNHIPDALNLTVALARFDFGEET